MEGVASHLAKYFSIAARSVAVISWTAFSSVCCFFVSLADICASPSDLAPKYTVGPCLKAVFSLNGFEATSNPPFERIDYRR